MIELTTGYLNLDEMEREILHLADDFEAVGVEVVYVTFGFGCRRDELLQSADIPVPISGLATFVADSERKGQFQLGESDLKIEAMGVTITLCHEGDIHCEGEESALFNRVRARWASDYFHSHRRQHGNNWRRLSRLRKRPR